MDIALSYSDWLQQYRNTGDKCTAEFSDGSAVAISLLSHETECIHSELPDNDLTFE